MSFVDEGPVVEISVDIGKSADVASSDFVDSVGTEGRLQNVVGTEDGKPVLHDMQGFPDMASCDQSMNVIFAVGSGGRKPAIAADQAARPTGPTAQAVVPQTFGFRGACALNVKGLKLLNKVAMRHVSFSTTDELTLRL